MSISKTLGLLLVACLSTRLSFATFNSPSAPYMSDNLQDASQSASLWQVNGSSLSESSSGAVVTSTSGASLISKVAVPDGTSQYQVAFNTNTPYDNDVNSWYILYLQATSNALLNPNGASTGSFYAFAIRAYALSDGSCASQATLYKTVNGSVSQVASQTLACQTQYIAVAAPDGSLRLAIPSASARTEVPSYTEPMVWTDTGTKLVGSAGIGLVGPTDGSGVRALQAQIYAVDRTAPAAVPATSIKTYLMPTEVDLQAAGSTDDSQGVGVYQYNWYRDGQYIASTFTPEYSDLTVAAGSTHSYGVAAMDYDGNSAAATSVSVTTPTSAAVNPREIGVRASGTYWGGMGEQIDTRSGNLNYSYSLLSLVSRTLSLPLGLSYNSQNWRQDNNGTVWNLGFDTGNGYGWQLQFGSITPYYSSPWNVAFYLFRDASGATYRLDQNNNGIWTSKDTTYVSFNGDSDDLLFNDGSFWAFHEVSGGTEQDAGTLYPDFLRDANGNFIYVDYQPANGNPNQSSARIADISDARNLDGQTPTYVFHYDGNGYLTSITNNLQSGESFSFVYTPVTLAAPFSSAQSFGAVKLLSSVTNSTTGLVTSFSYDSSNSGELTQVTFPYGGHLRWQYGATAYAQGAWRAVQNRYLLWDNNIGERSFNLAMTLSGNSSATANTVLTDSHANAAKKWTFDTAPDATQGLVTAYQQFRSSDGRVLRQFNYTWAQDPAGRNYISRAQDTLDPGQSYASVKQTDQTIDQYGNVTQTKLYAFGNLSSAAKTYNHTYVTDTNYTSRHMYNRLLHSTVTDAGGNTLTLIANTYDGSSITAAPGVLWLDTPNSDPSFVYRGNVTSSVSFGRTVNRRYDVTGTVVYTDDGNANHSLTMTNSSSNGYGAPSALTTANSLTTSLSWNSVLAPLSRTGPNNDTDSMTYDASTAQPTSKTSPYGAVTNYIYSTSAPQITATNNGRWVKTYLDGLGRVRRTERGDSTATKSVTETVYDTCGCNPVGKVYQQSMPHAPGAAAVWTVYTFDALGRQLTVTKPDGQSKSTYVYQGSMVTINDPAGNWKNLTRDAFGQLVQVEEPSPKPASEPNHITLYSYDILGHLTQVQMSRTVGGQVRTQYRTWVYDPNTMLLASKTSPEAGTVQYTYNSDGTKATETDAKSQRAVYSYDNYGRVIQIARGTVANGVFTENTTQRTTYAYEGTNSGYSAATKGRVSQITYAGPHGLSVVEMYSYHNAGGATKKRMQMTGALFANGVVNLEAGYTYDNEGHVTSIAYPATYVFSDGTNFAGPVYNYTYDSLGRLNGMTDQNNTSWVSSVSYGPADEVLQMQANGFTETRTYNANLQLIELVSGANVHRRYNYSATQNNGQILSQQDVVSGETISYQYDSLQRLVQASATGDSSGAWSQAMTYDGFGNLTQKVSSNAPALSVAVDWATNRIQTNAAYDANGNLTGYAGDGYSYDGRNRMVQANPASGGTVLYGYDTRNRRIYKGAYDGAYYSSEEIYFYGVDGHKYGTWIVNAFSQHPLTLMTTKQWFGARLLSPEDRLGSQGRYFAYGEERPNVSPTNPGNGQEKFATYTRDSATGLDYADQRYYSSTMGRFTTPDAYQARNALMLPENWNRYVYVGDDPANKNDPSGACSPSDDPPCYSGQGIGYADDSGGGGSGGGPRLRPIQPAEDKGSGTPIPVDSKLNDDLRLILQNRLADFKNSHCADVFAAALKQQGASLDRAGFVAATQSVNYYDATAAPDKNYAQNTVSVNGVLTTLGQTIGGSDAVTLINGAVPVTLIGARFNQRSGNSFYAENTLYHEYLHTYFNTDDAGIYNLFKSNGLTPYNSFNTESISAWLSTDCQSTPNYSDWDHDTQP